MFDIVFMRPPLVPVLSHMNPVHIIKPTLQDPFQYFLPCTSRLPKWSSSPVNTLYMCLISPMRATCLAHTVLTLIICGEEKKLRSCSRRLQTCLPYHLLYSWLWRRLFNCLVYIASNRKATFMMNWKTSWIVAVLTCFTLYPGISWRDWGIQRKYRHDIGLPVLSPRHGASSGCRWRRRPPDMEGSCQYIE